MVMEDERIIKIEEERRLTLRLRGRRRILVWGETGAGKSTLAFKLARDLSRSADGCQILSLDPGTPPFGVPGAVCRGWRDGDDFHWGDCQALCTLDAARFRLPLAMAASRLIEMVERTGNNAPVVIDPPGVARGASGAELLTALAEILRPDIVLALHRAGESPPLEQELASLRMETIHVSSSPEAKRPSATERAKRRTNMWDGFLSIAPPETVSLGLLRVLGTPPSKEEPEAWRGRQAALLSTGGETIRMGEVLEFSGEKLTMRISPAMSKAVPAAVLIRDAARNAEGMLGTVPRVFKNSGRRRIPEEMKPRASVPNAGSPPVSTQVGPAWAVLAGGVFGDPLLHVRIRNLKQSFLFDLGDPARLQAKAAHQVRAVFLSHAHVDHIGGFLWLLRSRFGPFGPCAIFGPPDTIARIENFLGAVTWDRIGDDGPVFEVSEIGDRFLKRARLQPGKTKVALPERIVQDGTILSDESFGVKAVVCDHGIPSVAYALVFSREIATRKDELEAGGLPPGPWLGQLKKAVAADAPELEIRLPDGTAKPAGELAKKLIEVLPGKKLVYAADMADTPENRRKLIALARSAHTLFCETAFTMADRDKAEATRHLTTRAAVEIARAAEVRRLAPFHFSKRYEHDPNAVYDEIRKAAGPVEILGDSDR